ncbi:fibronectin type III domain-containing protein [Marinobacter sp. C2H3]|uniref:fibronectin type III domain-containing protein n=1 Tax=Marinobacter sp. C2H3 TaxID=3119003 RepID=UPI00300E93DD
MDQNENGVGGESLADQFTVGFRVAVADVIVKDDLLISEDDPSFEGKFIVVESGTVTVDGSYDFKGLQLNSGATLTGTRPDAPSHAPMLWTFDSLVIEEGAVLDVSGLGLPPSELVGLESGGSHGGLGASPTGGNVNPVFGDRFEPVEYGVGGRGTNDDLISYGGGALKLEAQELVVKGTIQANGGFARFGRSGASGGSLWIETDALSGQGMIVADGSTGDIAGANGGGGRISLTYRHIDGFDPGRQLRARGDGAAGAGSVYVHRSHYTTRVRNIHLSTIHPDPSGTLTIEFSEPVDMSSFQASDVYLYRDGGVIVPVTDIVQVSDHVYEIRTQDELANGQYHLTVAPNIASTSGFGMDQDQDDLIGEPEDDAFVFDFEIFAADKVVNQDLTIAANDPDFTGKRILVDGGTLRLQGTYNLESLRVSHGGEVVAADGGKDSPTPLSLILSNELVVDKGARIAASGLGYGPSDSQPDFVGGSHGGAGGPYSGVLAGATYGDLLRPQTAGRGGKYSSEARWSRGGGALRIAAANMHINGRIESNGSQGSHSYSPGGAGGSVWLTSTNLVIGDSAQVTANGGDSTSRGSGGGGRVALYFSTYQGQSLATALKARSGSGPATSEGSAGTVFWQDETSGHSVLQLDNGGDRSGAWLELTQLPEGLDELYLIGGRMKLSVASVPDVLVVDNAEVELTVPQIPSLVVRNSSAMVLAADQVTDLRVEGSSVSQASAMEVSELRLSDNSTWQQAGYDLAVTGLYDFQQSDFVQDGVWSRPEGNDSLTVSGYELTLFGAHTFDRLEIGNGGAITTLGYNEQIPASGTLQLTVNELIVGEGSRLSATESGYGPVDGQPTYVGGSHGGLGGAYGSSEPLPTYGDERSPVTLGQGGRYSSEVYWSKGGGALNIQAGSATIAGNIEANGGRGQSVNSPGGAGGSVWLRAQSLTIGESGQITANGGYSSNRPSGGGGRIAVYYESLSGKALESALSARDGSGSSIYSGSAGTVFWEDTVSGNSVLLLDNGGDRSGAWLELTQLPEGLDELYLIGGRMKLSVASVPDVLVVDNAEVELTVPQIPSLVVRNSSAMVLAADQVTDLRVEGSSVSQVSAMEVSELRLSDNSTWQQAGYDLAVTGLYDFQQSDFVQDGVWSRPEGNDSLTVSGYELTLFGAHTFDRLEIGNGGAITTLGYNEQIPASGTLQLTVNELIVGEGSRLSATESGYGPVDGQPTYAGGSHGGLGGAYGSSEPLPTYGDERSPVTLGQGGRYSSEVYWSKGGGALNIQAGSATIDGTVEANGGRGSNAYSPGGAGGSVWLHAQSLNVGAGAQISANGGYSRYAGTGGGGRVAIFYATALSDSFDLMVNAAAGTGSSRRGEAGSVVIEQQQTPTAVRNVSLNTINNLQVSSFDVWFTNAIAADSLSIEDITLQGSSGAVVIANVSAIDAVQFHIELTAPLADGNYALTVGPNVQSLDGFGMDQNGNGVVDEPDDAFSFSFVVDTSAPEPVMLTSHLAGGAYDLAERRVSFSGARTDTAAIWINGKSYVPSGTGPWQVDDFQLSEGDNTVVFIAIDEAGNHSEVNTVTFNVDSIAPVKTGQFPTSYINAPPGQIRVTGNDEGSGLALEGSQLSVQRDGVNIAGTVTLNGNDLVFSPAGSLLEGHYNVLGRLADQRGNVSGTYTQSFTLDVTKPLPPALGEYPETTSQSSVLLDGGKEVGASLLLNGETISSNEASASWTFAAELHSGENVLTFTQRDHAGNVSDPAVATINFDDSAPGPVIPLINADGDGKTIRLNWSAYDEVANGNDIRHYRVYVQALPFNAISGIAPYAYLPAGQQSLTVTELQRNTPVYVAIVAEDKTGLMLVTVPSVEVTPVDTQPPEDPASLSVTPSSTSLRLAWTPSTNTDDDLAGYRVTVDKGSDGVEQFDVKEESAEVVGNTIVYTVDALSPASTYPLTVQAYDQDANVSSGVSNPGVTLLANPSNLSSEAFSGKVTLNWSPSKPAALVAGYNVYVSNAMFTTITGMQPRIRADKAAAAASVAGLENGTTYYMAVTAVNLSGGEEPQVIAIPVEPVEDEDGPEITRITYVDGTGETDVTDGMAIRHNGQIRVYAKDPSGLARLELKTNGQTLGNDYSASPAFEVPWNLIGMDDGSYLLTGHVYDTLDNSTPFSVTLDVNLDPPGSPTIASPASGTTTNQPEIEVTGQSGVSTVARLSVNGVPQAGTVTASALGRFKATVPLTEGDNQIVVDSRYVNRTEFGAPSSPITVTLDLTAPDAPAGLSATSKPLGQIALNWSAVENAAGYYVFRAQAPFVDTSDALRLTGQPLAATSYQDLPENDGTYYYRVVAVNDLGTPSPASPQASAVADSEAPYAKAIYLTPKGSQDPTTGRTGPGQVDVEIVFNEPLKTEPYLAYTVSGGLPMVAELTRDYSDETRYRGSFLIKESSVSGTALAVLSAHDKVGNRGTEVEVGDTFLVDTKGPEVAKLQINPGSPIKNDPDESGQGREVEVIMTLADDVKPGELPVLIPFIGDSERNDVVPGLEAGIGLSLDGSSVPGMPVYAGRFRLPLSAGQDDTGQPTSEQLGFQYSAADDLGNEVRQIAGDPRFQVYQGDLPPAEAPSGLVARALPGGRVELRWNPVDDASGYVVYRQAPAEAELKELKSLTLPETPKYVDGDSTALADGHYQYAIASVRTQNGQTAESGLSNVVSVNADGTPPDSPQNLSLELGGSGVIARWQPPASEAQDGLLRYNLYRIDLAEGASLTTVEGYTPIQNAIPDIIALDSRPSATDHLYVVTAVDPAGNESAPSASQYLNVELLPVSDLHISLAEDGRPALTWDHAKASSVGFDVFDITSGQPRQLNAERLTSASYEDLDYNAGNVASGAPADRLYRVVAVDSNDVASVGHDLLLPALSVSLVDDGTDAQLNRGIMNRVMFRVANSGQSTVVQARLKVSIMDDGDVREHVSERFTVAPGGYTDVPVVIGGYDSLPSLTSMDVQIVLAPKPGQQVVIAQQQDIQVGQSGLVASIETDAFVRGGTGNARILLENPSDVETEILTATGKGQDSSTEVRLVLKDLDGNVLSSQPVQQVTGDVVSLGNGETVARIPPHGTYRSQPFSVPVPSTAPDDVRVHLEIDRFRYQSGRDTFVAIDGTQASAPVNLEETPYYGEITSISPETGFTGDPIIIRGRAIDRQANSPLANVPLTLVLSSRGFERTFPVFSGVDGSVEYRFTPGAAESGTYRVSLLHPNMVERPEQGSFTIEGAGVSPTRARLTIPRNYGYELNIKVSAGYATELKNVRLVYAAPADAQGQPLPSPEGLTFDLGAPTNVAANKTAYLNLTLTGDASAADHGTLRFDVCADNRDAPLDTVSVEYFLTEARPVLLPQPSLINTGVGLDQSQQESVQLENTGLEAAKDLRLTLVDEQGQPAPSWFTLMTPAALGDLDVGATADIQVAVSPDSAVSPGDYYFNVQVDGGNTTPLKIPVLVAVTNSGTGSVFIHSTDIYTATLDENMQPIPGLGNVKVKLQNTDVLSEVFNLTTDANGYGELSDIPAGQYSYRASAFDHEPVSGTLWVKPGVTTNQQLFLMNNLINVEFSVTEITLEDRYDVVLNATYETNVPAPVVLFEPMSVNLPMLEKGEVYQGEFTITNYGLIEAFDVAANLPTGDDYARFDYLTDIPDVIKPGQVVRVPYRIVALQDFMPSAEGEATGGGCVRRNYRAICTYSAECAVGSIIDNAATMVWNAIAGSSCGAGAGSVGGSFFGGGYFGSGGGGGTNYSPAPPTAIGTAESFCPGEDGSDESCGGQSGTEGGG